MATKKSQRIIIWIIAIVMTVGTLGLYFLMILQTDNASSQTSQQEEQEQAIAKENEKPKEVDPTAYIVKEKVMELKIEDLRVGEGEEVKAGDTITAHYKGTLATNGQKFDSSYDRGEPATFGLSQVITGWQEGVPGMKVGGKRRLIIPADMAYGATAQAGIPANSDLVFEVEVLGIGDPTSAQSTQESQGQ